MREILFRGKDKYNGEWIEGYYYLSRSKYAGDKSFVSEVHTITTGIREVSGAYGEHSETIKSSVIPETVGQYTGLTDKNGTKIFEGDILKQKTTPEFAKVNSFEWEHYGIVRFGYYDWDEGEAGYGSMGWYIEPLKSVSIKPKNYHVGHIQAGLNQSDILNKYYPMEVIGNIHDNPELLKVGD